MRVLLCSLDSPATLQGGVEWYVHHLACALGKIGHDVRVLSRRPPAGASVPEGVRYEWADLPDSDGPTTHRYRLRHEPAYWRSVRRASEWADIIHSMNMDAFGATRGKPVVATVHTTPIDEWPSSRLGGWREWAYQREIEAYRRFVWRRFLSRATHVWTQGRHVAESIRALGGRSVEILPNPVPHIERMPQDEARRALGLPAGPLVLYLGRLAPVKRPHLVLEALRDLPDAHAVIAGEGPERARLEALASDPALRERVRLLGRVADREKALLLNAADVVALPSEHEGQPLILLEALAVGTPVVATDAGWVPSGFEPYGFWGTDLPRLLRDAFARGRGKPAPVLDYDAVAKRVSEVYERCA